jgi:hypothetical protein
MVVEAVRVCGVVRFKHRRNDIRLAITRFLKLNEGEFRIVF